MEAGSLRIPGGGAQLWTHDSIYVAHDEGSLQGPSAEISPVKSYIPDPLDAGNPGQ